MSLVWGDSIPDESRFVIYGCNNGDCTDAVQLTTVNGGTAAFEHMGLAPSAQYCYRVKAEKTAACTTGWETLYSNIGCATTISAQPRTLAASAVNAFKIQLTWDDMASDEDGYEIEVKAWNGKWVKTATVGADVTVYTDNLGLDPLKTYTYRVRAFRGSDKSPYSNEAAATTPAYVPGDSNCR
jgi:phosphodiesterase/alkaline phosphatase D-like protein